MIESAKAIKNSGIEVEVVTGVVFILLLRIIPPILDKLVTNLLNKPYYSICLVAYKPRFSG